MTGEQYTNTIAQIFGADISNAVAPPLPPLARTDGLLSSGAAFVGVTSDQVQQIQQAATSVAEKVVDDVNILQATYRAMEQAIAALSPAPDYVLLDAVTLAGVALPQKGMPKGDQLSISIAAASIIAKVTRDRLMVEYDRLYPEYGFAGHKGYGTKQHRQAIAAHGPCPIHRKTFRGVKEFLPVPEAESAFPSQLLR